MDRAEQIILILVKGHLEPSSSPGWALNRPHCLPHRWYHRSEHTGFIATPNSMATAGSVVAVQRGLGERACCVSYSTNVPLRMSCSPVMWINIHGNSTQGLHLVISRPLTFLTVYFHIHKAVSVVGFFSLFQPSAWRLHEAYWVSSTVTRDKCNGTIMEHTGALCSTIASPFLLSHIHIRNSTLHHPPRPISPQRMPWEDSVEPFWIYDKPQSSRKVEREDVISM